VSNTESTIFNKAIIKDAWDTLFRWITRVDVETAAYRFFHPYINESVFTLMPRPNFEAAGMQIIPIPGTTFYAGYSGNIVVYLPKAAQGASGRKFPLIMNIPADDQLYCIEAEGWGHLAIENDIILVTASSRAAEPGQSILNYLVANYPVDETRVYITGFSGGAHGALFTAEQIPERFAAVAPCDVFDGPYFKTLHDRYEGFDYDLDMPVAIFANGMSTESTNYDGHYHWFEAVQQIFDINEIPRYQGELDYVRYPFWGFPIENEIKIGSPPEPVIWQGFSYDENGIPMVSEIHTENAEHSRYIEYAQAIWRFFKLFSRDPVSHAIIYTP
jgi:hypothetical protein